MAGPMRVIGDPTPTIASQALNTDYSFRSKRFAPGATWDVFRGDRQAWAQIGLG